MEQIIIKRENWEKVARAVGENQDIHFDDEIAKRFGFDSAVCPGVYLLALAESEVDRRWLYRKPRIIKGKFRNPLYEGDVLCLERNDHLALTKSNRDLVARIDETDFPVQIKLSTPFNIITEITPENLALFYEGIEARGEKVAVPYTFGFGSIIRSVLEVKKADFAVDSDKRVVLGGMTFSLCNPLKIGTLSTKVSIVRKENPKGILYRVFSDCYQNKERVVCGDASGWLRSKKAVA